MYYEEIKITSGLSYISFCSLNIFCNGKFISMATSFGTNAFIVMRVHCIMNYLIKRFQMDYKYYFLLTKIYHYYNYSLYFFFTAGLNPPSPCQRGHYCPAMTTQPDQWPCPAGTFTTSSNLWDASQCTNCTAGYYCEGRNI